MTPYLAVLRDRLKQGTFLPGALALGSGVAIAQLLAVASSPVLARLYGPADFGKLGLFLAFLGLFGVLTSLGYEMAIVGATDDIEAGTLTGLAGLIAIVTSAAAALDSIR